MIEEWFKGNIFVVFFPISRLNSLLARKLLGNYLRLAYLNICHYKTVKLLIYINSLVNQLCGSNSLYFVT